MHNELTAIDLQKMQEELNYRRITLRPQLLEEVLGSYESRHAGMEYAHLRGVLRRR